MFALLGVLCQIMPYIYIIDIINGLINKTLTFNVGLSKCIYMGIWWIIRYLFHSISTTLSHKATFHVLSNMRYKLLDKLSTMPLGDVLSSSSGSYKNIIVERVDSIETLLAHIVPEFTSNIIGAIVIFIMLWIVDYRLALSMFITIPIGLLCFLSMFKDYESNFQRTIDSTKILNDTAVEYINGIEVIKAFGKSKVSYQKFQDAAIEGANCFIEWMGKCIFGQSGGMTIFPATLLGLLPVGCLLMINKSLEPSSFIVAIVLSFGIMTPLITVFSYTDDIAQVSVVLKDIKDILSKDDLIRAETLKDEFKDNSIEVKDVYFSYDKDEVLHGVNMFLKEGSVNAIVGPSGSGKSTIAKLIASLWDVNKGEIKIGGINVKDIPLEICSSKISYVSQDNYLFNLSIKDNIKMGKPDVSDEEIIECAKKCGCHDFIMNLENGYNTICGTSGGHLSGGERQRIAITRAMLKDAPIVILDEATSYTDPENEAIIQEALASLIKGKTLLMIAHRLSTIKNVDNIFVIKDGSVLDNGKHSKLIQRCKLYEDMWNAHMSVKDNKEAC